MTTNTVVNVVAHHSEPLGNGQYTITPAPVKNEGWGLVYNFYNPTSSSIKYYTCLTYNNKVIILENRGRFYYPYSEKSTGANGGRGFTRVKIGDGKYRFNTFGWHAFWDGFFTEEIPKKYVTRYVPLKVLNAMGYKI